MSHLAACTVSLRHLPENTIHSVELRHYEHLKEQLDQGLKGWVELDSVWGDGKVFCRLEDITDLFQGPPDYCEARDQWDREQKAEEITE